MAKPAVKPGFVNKQKQNWPAKATGTNKRAKKSWAFDFYLVFDPISSKEIESLSASDDGKSSSGQVLLSGFPPGVSTRPEGFFYLHACQSLRLIEEAILITWPRDPVIWHGTQIYSSIFMKYSSSTHLVQRQYPQTHVRCHLTINLSVLTTPRKSYVCLGAKGSDCLWEPASFIG